MHISLSLTISFHFHSQTQHLQVTRNDIISVLPFGNVIVKASVTGEQILSMLEWSVHNLDNVTSTGNLFGAFLQYSGLQVKFT